MAAISETSSAPPLRQGISASELAGQFDRSPLDRTAAASSGEGFQFWNPVSWYKTLSRYREELSLPQPGSIEKINKEMKVTTLTNFFFEGGSASLTKMLSPNFQVMHTFQLGLPGSPSSYNFASVYANEQGLMHGSMDNEGNLQARWHYAWSKALETRVQAQLARGGGQSMV
ncbi:translocase of outer mitochondrial membrane, partial [Spiromyces aspiralis]